MKEITIDGINYVCEAATEVAQQAVERAAWIKYVEIGAILIVVFLTLLGLIIGFKKMKDEDDEDEDESEKYY